MFSDLRLEEYSPSVVVGNGHGLEARDLGVAVRLDLCLYRRVARAAEAPAAERLVVEEDAWGGNEGGWAR